MIKKGAKVKFDYTLTVDGKVQDTSAGRGPLEYTHGAGQIIQGLEEVLERAEKLLPGMADGALKCRLYGYCHYYTGAEECREEMLRILENLPADEKYLAGMAEN